MRIQILPLPSVMVGEDMDEPFALIVDQWPDGAYDSSLQGFADMCGAKAVWVRSETVEVVDRFAETPPQEPTPKPAALTTPDRIVLRDRNGNAMNMWATCSCGAAMTFDLAASWQEKTEIVCKRCGNRLTVTVPRGSQA